MVTAPPRRLAVSTWSLHRTLGKRPSYGPDRSTIPEHDGSGLALVELPDRLARFGITTLELCHFHLPSRTPEYLAELRSALEEAGVELFSLLIDAGDITDPANGERDRAWIGQWLADAERLGAKRTRVSAGKAPPTPEQLAASEVGLRRLARVAQDHGVRLTTENWHATLSNAEAVNRLLDGLDGQVGLCADFGNWTGPSKYEELAAILPRAESCHAKCHFGADGTMDRADYVRCLDLMQAASFAGPYTLIYDGPDPDEWTGLAAERDVVRPYLEE